jgi:hypothetical protein
MKKFLGLSSVTGIARKPKFELYWSMRGIYHNPVFPQTMSRNKFQLIQRYLHFNDNNAAGTKIHTSDAVSSPLSSHELQGLSRTPTLTPTRRAPKNDPPGRLDGKLQNHILVHIAPQKKIKCQHKNVECVREKNIKK